jgi:hypothetical protein
MISISPQSKLDVVYPLATAAKGPDDFELRYSLRSLESQPWAGNVFVIGHKPAWIKNTVHIPFPDQWNPNFKDKNIIKKMLRASADGRVSDPFVANSDDQYWLRVIDPGEMLIPPRENPPQMEARMGGRMNPYPPSGNYWVRRQAQTVRFLRGSGKCATCFDGHVPYLIHKAMYLETMSQIPWEMGDGFLIVVYHGWNWEAIGNGTKIEDRDGALIRIKADMPAEEIERKTQGALFLNHNNKALGDGMKKFLIKRFPNPSRWE